MTTPTTAHDNHPSLQFLQHLDPSPKATFNIECYTDVPKSSDKPRPDPLSRHYANKTIREVESLLPEIHALNEQGAGIFVARNQCDGPRNVANVSRVRGVHADMDGVSEEKRQALIAALPPSIVVQSSGPDNVHVYLQLSDGETLDKDETKTINRHIVAEYGADPAAVDVARLLRLPGFKHMKYRGEGKTPTVTAEYFDVTYSANQIRAAFPAYAQEEQQTSQHDENASNLYNGHGAVKWTDLPTGIRTYLDAVKDGLNEDLTRDSRFRRLLANGDMSPWGNDHSRVDQAFCTWLAQAGFTSVDIDMALRATPLYRDKWERSDYRQRTIAKALDQQHTDAEATRPANEDKPPHDDEEPKADNKAEKPKSSGPSFDDPAHWKPNYVAAGMPARQFNGPSLDGSNRLFPATALSLLVANGGTGKTTLVVSIACHVAAGKDWNGYKLRQAKVIIISVEETQAELDRKFSAVIESWTPTERQDAEDNLRLVSCIGQDVRLITTEYGKQLGTGWAEAIIKLANEFGVNGNGVVFLDHLQGFASGDLNSSETATGIAREANRIVDGTGSAVVFAAHISKGNIKAETVEQGFAVGSLAIENAARQLSGMIRMTEDQAKTYGFDEDQRQNYRWLGLPKNSYGEANAGVWLKAEFVPKFHTVTMIPVTLTPVAKKRPTTANDALKQRIIDYLIRTPFTSGNQLDAACGQSGPLKASKAKVRSARDELIAEGRITSNPVTDAERKAYNIAKQVKEVYRVTMP